MLRTFFMLGVILASVGVGAHEKKYKCPECGKIETYDEASYHTHYCTGTKEKSHSKRIMESVDQ